MEYITSQNAAVPVTSEAAEAGGCAAGDGESGSSRVKLTVEHLLSRLGLSQLSSLVDDATTLSDNVLAGSVRPDVHVIRSSSSHTADDAESELRDVGQSLAVLLQLLRRCTNWPQLLSVDASLSDALARLTEHEFSGGTMRYGVHTDDSVQRLAARLTVSDDACRHLTARQLTSVTCEFDDDEEEPECHVKQTLSASDVTVGDSHDVSWTDSNDVRPRLKTEHNSDTTELVTRRQSASRSKWSVSDCRLDLATSLTSCARHRTTDVCCHVDQLDNDNKPPCDNRRAISP